MASPASTSGADGAGRPAPGVRSHLYVPGDRPAMLARAAERGADALIIDLEDAVVPRAKAAARRDVAAWLGRLTGQPAAPQVWVRINPAAGGLPPLHHLARAHAP